MTESKCNAQITRTSVKEAFYKLKWVISSSINKRDMRPAFSGYASFRALLRRSCPGWSYSDLVFYHLEFARIYQRARIDGSALYILYSGLRILKATSRESNNRFKVAIHRLRKAIGCITESSNSKQSPTNTGRVSSYNKDAALVGRTSIRFYKPRSLFGYGGLPEPRVG